MHTEGTHSHLVDEGGGPRCERAPKGGERVAEVAARRRPHLVFHDFDRDRQDHVQAYCQPQVADGVENRESLHLRLVHCRLRGLRLPCQNTTCGVAFIALRALRLLRRVELHGHVEQSAQLRHQGARDLELVRERPLVQELVRELQHDKQQVLAPTTAQLRLRPDCAQNEPLERGPLLSRALPDCPRQACHGVVEVVAPETRLGERHPLRRRALYAHAGQP
jgi:hypothetical protein